MVIEAAGISTDARSGPTDQSDVQPPEPGADGAAGPPAGDPTADSAALADRAKLNIYIECTSASVGVSIGIALSEAGIDKADLLKKRTWHFIMLKIAARAGGISSRRRGHGSKQRFAIRDLACNFRNRIVLLSTISWMTNPPKKALIEAVPQAEGASELRQVLGHNLRMFRLAVRMSQRELSLVSGISQKHISRIEAAGANIGIDVLDALARALPNVTAADLLTPTQPRRSS